MGDSEWLDTDAVDALTEWLLVPGRQYINVDPVQILLATKANEGDKAAARFLCEAILDWPNATRWSTVLDTADLHWVTMVIKGDEPKVIYKILTGLFVAKLR